MAYILTILVLATIWRTGQTWDNSYDGELFKVCPNNQHVSFVKSKHHNYYEDRLFELNCRAKPSGASTTRCYWSGWVNDYDQFFAFQCNGYGFIHGMRSVHINYYEDRRWRFYCCELTDYRLSECYYTHRNGWDAYFAVSVPEGSVMRGVTSSHSNYYEDRQYKFQICQLKHAQ